MKLRDLLVEAAIVDIRTMIVERLLENVNDYLSLTMAKLKNKKPEEAFKAGDPQAVDLDHLALIVTGLYILSNPDYRAGITKQDVGMNPNDLKELFNLLDQVNKQGKDPIAIQNVFKMLCNLAKPALKKKRAELDILQTGDDAERKHELQELEKFTLKVSQMFNKLKSGRDSWKAAGGKVELASLGDL
jgi:hypothetical protein